jgi:hypothetical protein
MKGLVKIIDELSGKTLLDYKFNLTVLTGRAVTQQRFTNVIGPTADYRSYTLGYFAIGTGGADPNNPLIPLEPNEADTGLYLPLQLNAVGTSPTYLPYIINNISTPGVLKQIGTSYITNTSNTTTAVELQIAQTDVSTTSPIYYNEAGLFATSGTNYVLTAHICFPSVIKTPDRSQRMFWYLFF